jgi:hypothetical protein
MVPAEFLTRALRWFERRPRPKLTEIRAVSEEELAGMFLHAPDNPAWKATLAVLDLEVQEQLELCLEETLSNDVLRHRLGAVAGLLRFKQVLRDRETEARRREQEREEPAEQGA